MREPVASLAGMRVAADASSRSSFNVSWLVALFLLAGCASQRIDPHTPGDRCLYGCPDEMICAGTTFPRGRQPEPGHCQLAPNRCLAAGDCRPRERCVRPGEAVGVCQPEGLL